MNTKKTVNLYLPEDEFKLFSENCKNEYTSASAMLGRLMKQYNQKAKEANYD